VTLVLVVLAVAVAVGWSRGGSLDRLGELPLRSRRLVVGALGAQLLGTAVGGPFYPLGLVASAGLVVVFLARNRGIRGTGLVALGLLANALVVAANGAMPVSDAAAARAGVGVQDLVAGTDARHELAGPGTRLSWLADVVPVPMPLRPEVVSVGDVLVAAGLGQLVALGMAGSGATDRVGTPRPRRQGRQRGAPPPLPAWVSTTRTRLTGHRSQSTMAARMTLPRKTVASLS
jgi:hypothetical protein